MNTPVAESLRAPFRGLRFFEEQDAHLFFGRDEQIDELSKKLQTSRFVTVIGSSGSGKSSLVRAGLVHRLCTGLIVTDAGSRWRVAVMRPGSAPVANLASALERIASASGMETSLRRGPLGLVDAAREAGLQPGENLLVVVDQFEELFRFPGRGETRRDAGQEVTAFVKLLLEASDQKQLPIHVVLTMRSDFLGNCARFRDLPERINDGLYLIPRMRRDQMEQAIVGPIGVAETDIAPRLVQGLLNEVGDDPDQLPVLQHTLLRTWNQWVNRRTPSQPIDLEDYDPVGPLKVSLSKHANDIHDQLSARQQHLTRVLFQRLTERDPENREIRHPALIEEIAQVAGMGVTPEEITQIVDRFGAPGAWLLIRNDQGMVDITHEALIRQWDKIQGVKDQKGWLQEEAEARDIYLELATRARRARGEEDLLSGGDLERALRWREETRNEPWSLRYDPTVGGFNKTRQFVADSQSRYDRQQRKQHYVVGALATLTLLAVGAAAFATIQRNKAESAQQRETVALERKLELERENAVSRTREAEERRALTDGQIERLRSLRSTLKAGEDLPKSQSEAVLDSVANFLWSKGEEGELQRILKDADDLFPDRYGVDNAALSNTLLFDASAPWPLELHYGPASEVDPQLLLYHWQGMAEMLTRDWGIPVPSRIKLMVGESKTLPAHQFRLVVRSSEQDPKRAPPEARFSVQSERDQFVVGDPGSHPEKQRLRKFLDEYGQGRVKLSSDRIGRTYYLVPKWTQPVWKVAGHGSFSREILIALSAANRMLEEPELFITSDSIKPVLKRIAAQRPKIVEEALAARGSLVGLASDFREIFRRKVVLVHAELLLDLLANYPGRSSVEAVDLALRAQEHFPDGLPAKLPGRRGRGVPELATALESKYSFQHAYNEVVPWLPFMEEPIRVSVGRGLDKRFTRGIDLTSEVLKSMEELRGKINRRFGFAPGNFMFLRDDNLKEDEFRIEILHQTNRHQDATPIAATPNRALATLIAQLEFRYIAARAWWLNTDEVNRRLQLDVPDNLRTWLLKRYTLTDLKLLLQAQVAPSTQELDAYTNRRDEAGYQMIRNDGTIQDLSWLLGSLAFWVNSGPDSTDIGATVGWLRRVQRSRLIELAKTRTTDEAIELTQKGIDQLASGDIDGASGTFSKAAAADKRRAGEAFLALYADKVRPVTVDHLPR